MQPEQPVEPGPWKPDRVVIVRSLVCRRCGYDLRGQRLSGQCPECGLDVQASLLQAIDPDSAHLPLLRNPLRVGDSLLALTGCLVAALLLVTARSIALILAEAFGVRAAPEWVPAWVLLGSALFMVVAAYAVRGLFPPRGREPRGALRRDLWILASALAAAGALAVGGWVVARLAGAARVPGGELAIIQSLLVIQVVVALPPLTTIFRVIGERSREYRTARGSRQRLRDLVAAALAIGLGAVLRQTALPRGLDLVATIGTTMVCVCTLMFIVGLVYVLWNVSWIRRTLRRPPATLLTLLRPTGRSEQETGWEL